MKKIRLVFALVFLLALSACAGRSAEPAAAGDPRAEGVTVSDTGEWPVNDYTEGLPVPAGKVAWTMLDAEHGTCSISVAELSEEEFKDYQERLTQAGFSAVENVSEAVKGQSYVSIGTLLSNGEKSLSISYVPDTLTIYISFEQ